MFRNILHLITNDRCKRKKDSDTANYKSTGTITYREYYVRKSKPIIDEINTILAEHYGFTVEELDFIIN